MLSKEVTVCNKKAVGGGGWDDDSGEEDYRANGEELGNVDAIDNSNKLCLRTFVNFTLFSCEILVKTLEMGNYAPKAVD